MLVSWSDLDLATGLARVAGCTAVQAQRLCTGCTGRLSAWLGYSSRHEEAALGVGAVEPVLSWDAVLMLQLRQQFGSATGRQGSL